MKAVLAAVLATLSMAPPAIAQARCLSAPDAEAIALVALPDIIRAAAIACAALPSGSLLRQPARLIARYTPEADRAWPAARAAITKLSDPAVEMLLMSELARPLLTSLFAPQIVGRINPQDCPMLERLVTLLEPLPPRNTAGVIVAALQFLKAERARGRAKDAPDLPLCAAALR